MPCFSRSITQQFHDEIANELEGRQQILNDRLKKLTKDNKSFQVTASYLLDLAQRAEELFRCSNNEIRQKLLSYMISNVELNNKKLSYTLNNPFRELAKQNKKAQNEPDSKIWQGIADALQTAAITSNEDYNLKTLVDTFQLSGSLLTV